MPSQKRPRETTATPPSSPSPSIKGRGSPQGSENHERIGPENDSDSDGISYSSDGEKDEFIVVDLGEICKEVQCPICLGIIRKTRTVMECLHRFCRECIDKAMRLGNKECPACRTHCGSRRSLRDDPNYDALIAALYPDIEKYDEEDLSFPEEEKARNKQIQDSIAETSRRQAEALGKKRARKGKYRNHGSDEEEGGNESEVGKREVLDIGWGRSGLRRGGHGNNRRNDQFVNYLQCSDEKNSLPIKESSTFERESDSGHKGQGQPEG